MARRSSKKVVYAALLGNVLVALTKFAAAGLTGSSAMVSEAIHSLVDTGNEILLLYGLRRAARPPDELHPLGHGRELYFWSFIVTLLIFALGAGVSVYEGISHVIAPVPISNSIVNYVVLGLAFVFEGISWGVAIKEFRSAKGKRGYFEAVRQSKDPTMFMVLFEDTAALIGLMIALAGIATSEALDRSVLDGAASIGIGVLLGVVAMFLAREAKGSSSVSRPRWKWSRRSARSRAPIRASSARTVCSRCISAPTRSSRRSVSTSWTRSPPPTWRRSSPRSRSASGASIRRSCCC